MGEDDDGVNYFNQAASNDPPPPRGEGDYGDKVVKFKRRSKVDRPDWQSQWQLSTNAQPLPNLFNTMIALKHHPLLHNLLQYDEMACVPVLVNPIPNTKTSNIFPRPISQVEVLALQEQIQLAGLRRISKSVVEDAIVLRADQDRYHPVKNYLDSLVWDRTSRIDKWLSYYLGAEPAEDELNKDANRRYLAQVGRMFLIAMVARIMKPGCKSDYMLILEGPQGAEKSSACRILAGEWFSDNLPDLSRGDAVRLSMHLRGKWLIEIAEMSSFNAAETHKLKEFLTQTEERYTPKYGRHEVYEPRQCLFVGSINESTYLRDATGARRFWPVRVGNIDLTALAEDRDQLFAEAVYLYRSGERWWPDRAFEAEVILPEQVARYEEDPWQGTVENWIWRTAAVRANPTDILKEVLSIPVGQFGIREQRRVAAIFKALGWKSSRIENKRLWVR